MLKKVLLGYIFALIVFTGCDNKTTVTEVTDKPKVIKEEKVAPAKKELSKEEQELRKLDIRDKKKYDLSNVFKDSAKIAPNGKYMIIIFEAPECPYCAKMENDIYNTQKLKEQLKNDFTTYSLNAMDNKLHKLQHEGSLMDVDTKTLIDIYSVTSTPTLIFTDKEGKSIFVVPGYMPKEQFLVTLDFIKEQKWLGLDRKNGDVYKALKNYYIEHGIMKDKK